MTLNQCQYVCFAGFVDVFTDSKEAVVNHGHKLLKVGFKYHKECFIIKLNLKPSCLIMTVFYLPLSEA